ncbi:hypothetical protein HBH98_248830 [Parastagonospora nodorum]|nr:hypothetical protein HBH53_253350 [Parastagonospora nodorum]KAH3956147.1 hypothetical protein HBH51_251460 [Parastagonospora nodorum]KAH4215391.1 hypothetical protein HBI06_254000 [Parastagonospora nodorum]KAH4223076.1 hypothetical protein HBI05_249670 [Parastagonospora nodorum]KAH4333469.1 hypothetical protein HBH98_248830 [Parastagonospora nodorum]
MHLSNLPVEILLQIAECVQILRDYSALVRTDRRLFWACNTSLYRRDRDRHGNSALLWAASEGKLNTAQLSIAERAGTRAIEDCLQAALQLSVEKGHYALVALIIDNGADVNGKVNYFGNLLQVASWLGDLNMMKLLLDRGAKVNELGGHYGNALQAVSWNGSEHMMELLLARGAAVNAGGGYFGSALQGASWGGNPAMVRLLIDRGVDINARGGKYGTALHAASCNGHKEVVKMLLESGAKVDTPDSYFDNEQSTSLRAQKQVKGLLRHWYWRQSLTNAAAAAIQRGHNMLMMLKAPRLPLVTIRTDDRSITKAVQHSLWKMRNDSYHRLYSNVVLLYIKMFKNRACVI